MSAVSRLTRGFICKESQAWSRMSLGYICSPFEDVIIPPDYIPTFILGESQDTSFIDLFSKSPTVPSYKKDVPIIEPTSPNLLDIQSIDLTNVKTDVYNPPEIQLTSKEEAELFNAKEPDLIDPLKEKE